MGAQLRMICLDKAALHVIDEAAFHPLGCFIRILIICCRCHSRPGLHASRLQAWFAAWHIKMGLGLLLAPFKPSTIHC